MAAWTQALALDRFDRMRKQVFGLLGWLAISFAAAWIGALASTNAPDFYQQLARPSWSPPAWLFGPVWTALYTLMAIAAWLVWRQDGFRHARGALFLFLFQLALNALWSWLFFVWRFGALAFFEILGLWVLVLWTMVAFWRVRPVAGVLLVPYLAWVTFASALAYAIWQRNPSLLS